MSIAQSLVNPPTGYIKPLNEAHTEYPKYVHFPDGRPSVIVRDADEEAAVLAGASVSVPKPLPPVLAAPIPTLVGENDEKTMLLKIAQEKGIKVDGRWKLPKIRKAVEVASS